MFFRILIVFVLIFGSVFAKTNYEAVAGLQKTISVDIENVVNQPIELSYPWEFYPNQLLSSIEMNSQPAANYINVPQWWQDGENNPSIQFGSYRLKLILLGNRKGIELALGMPDVYCSYDLSVNGKLIGNNGKVGKSRDSTQPQWKPDTYTFTSESDTLDIIIHLSNFYHNRAGISKPIFLGSAQHLLKKQHDIETANVVMLATISILFLFGTFYFSVKKELPYLFYALLCFSWVVRTAFSNHYEAVQWFPSINWYFVARAEYIGIYLSTLFGSLLLGSLFPKDVNKLIRNFFILASVGFALFTLAVDTKIFTAYVQYYLALSSLLLVFILVIVLKAYIRRRKGSLFILFTAISVVVVFGYEILCYQGLFQLNELLFNGMFVVQFILILVAIFRRINTMGDDKDDYDRMTFDNYVSKVS